MSKRKPVLELRGVSKGFGAVQALSKVDLAIFEGEAMALVGDNGAGKSTLVKGLAGIYPYDEGHIFFNGEAVRIRSPKDSAKLGIEIVYQDLALAENLDVVGNMFLGREKVQVPWGLDEIGMEQATLDTIRSLGITTLKSVRTPVAGLSGGQRQAVAVAKAVMWNSKVVVLDEPTAALGVAQTRQVLNLVKRLSEQGLAVIVISHNMQDVFEVSDRIVVLRLGEKVADLRTDETSYDEVVMAMTAGATSRDNAQATDDQKEMADA